MGIYTKTGDKGETSLFDGSRVKKYSDRVNTYGTTDELNSFISLAEKKVNRNESKKILIEIQKKIFLVSAEIATADIDKLKIKSDIITNKHIDFLEDIIDKYSEMLPKVTSFVLPGRCESGAQLHVARTVCRRAERELIQLAQTEKIRPELLKYLNRLSDTLYILARVEDEDSFTDEIVKKIMKKYQEAISQSTGESVPQLTENNIYKHADNLIEKAKKKAKEIQIPVTIAVVDESGRLIAQSRMEDSLLVSLDLAVRKAYTAVAMKSSTHKLKDVSQPGATLYQLENNTDGKIVTFAGGIPIYADDKIIGAIGVSGGSTDEDKVIAEAGIN